MKYTWYKSIPEGSHGSTTIQKRLWKSVSDYVRIRDFHKYQQCVSCFRKPEAWNIMDWQGGHYVPYSVCRGYSKFFIENIYGQCSYCNRGFSGAPAGAMFKDTILRRDGTSRVKILDNYRKMPAEKLEDYQCLKMLKETLLAMAHLPEQPDYYEKTIKKEEFQSF